MSTTHKPDRSQLNKPFPERPDFSDQRLFIESLKSERKVAIEHAIDIVFRFLRKKYHHIESEVIRNIATDSTILTIHKIQQGKYESTGNKLSTYLIAIGINLLRNESRKRKWQFDEIDDKTYRLADSGSDFTKQIEHREIVGKIFEKIHKDCKRLLQLKYFKNLSDKEVLEQGLVQYKSIGAIKNRRSKCLKELKEQFSSFDASALL